MNLFSDEVFQGAIAFFNLFLVLAALIYAIVASEFLHKWIALVFSVNFLETVLAVPASYLGYAEYGWMQGNDTITSYLFLVTTAMFCHVLGYWLAIRINVTRLWLFRYPPLAIGTNESIGIVYVLSFFGALVSLALALSGHLGYFARLDFLENPPWWLDAVRTLVRLSLGLAFIEFLKDFSRRSSLSLRSWLLVAVWTLAGATLGYKAQVVLPFVLLGLATWLTGQLSISRISLVVLAVFASYAIVEPLRQGRDQDINSTLSQSAMDIVEIQEAGTNQEIGVLERLLKRVDYTVTAVDALDAYKAGGLEVYRERLSQSYLLFPLMAFIPRFVWRDKPLADHGRVLSIELSAGEFNSITPSHVVASYLWLGVIGVIINGLSGGIFGLIAGMLISRYRMQPLQYLPLLIFGISMVGGDSLMFHQYIGVLRGVVLIAIFYWIARAFNLTNSKLSP